MIVIWGVDNNICNPYAGRGFRRAFDTAGESQMFIREQVVKIPAHEAEGYVMYETDETKDLNQVMYIHNRARVDKTINYGSHGFKRLNVKELKEKYDEKYRKQLRQQEISKNNIDSQLKSMSNNEIEEQKRLFQQYNVQLGDK